MPEEHALLSASGAKKWINCTKSIEMEKDIPDKPSSYAAEGTTAHALGEAKLRLALKRITRVQYHKMIKDLEITEDMEEYTDGYRDFVLERYNAAKSQVPDAMIDFERRLDFSPWVPDGFGTGDVVILADDATEIIDLKYGQGLRVSAKENPQLLLYALGVIESYGYMYDIGTITTTIYQPRLDNIDSDTIPTEELLVWGERTKDIAQRAYNGEGECNAGKHCDDGFCKARPMCRAYAEQKLKLTALDFKKPAELSPEEIAEVMDQASHLAKWAEMVKSYALDQALNYGIRYPGFKIVEGRSNRTYAKPNDDIVQILTNEGYDECDLYKKELLSVSAMERFLSKAKFNELLGEAVIKPPGKPTLVPVEDRRPELNSAKNDFEHLIEKENK